MESGVAARSRRRAAVVDEALVGAIALLLVAMAVQTGAAPLAAMGLSRVLEPLGAGDRGVLLALLATTWLAVRLAYGTLAEGGPAAATPGKRMAGLRVADRAGAPPGYGRALARQVGKTVAVLSVVGLAAAATGRCWHDSAAGTRVVRAAPAPAPEGDTRPGAVR